MPKDFELVRNFLRLNENSGELPYTKVYLDPKKLPTISTGFNLTREKADSWIQDVGANFQAIITGKAELTLEQALQIEARIILEAEEILIKKLGKDIYSALLCNQQASLISLCVNAPFLVGPNLTSYVKNAEWEKAENEIRHRTNGTTNKEIWQGVQNRREREADLIRILEPDPVKNSLREKLPNKLQDIFHPENEFQAGFFKIFDIEQKTKQDLCNSIGNKDITLSFKPTKADLNATPHVRFNQDDKSLKLSSNQNESEIILWNSSLLPSNTILREDQPLAFDFGTINNKINTSPSLKFSSALMDSFEQNQHKPLPTLTALLSNLSDKPYNHFHGSTHSNDFLQNTVIATYRDTETHEAHKNSLSVTYNRDQGWRFGFTTKDPKIMAVMLAYLGFKELYHYSNKTDEQKAIDQFISAMQEMVLAEHKERSWRFCANPKRYVHSYFAEEPYEQWQKQNCERLAQKILPDLIKHTKDYDTQKIWSSIKYGLETNKDKFIKAWENNNFSDFAKEARSYYQDNIDQLKREFYHFYYKNELVSAKKPLEALNRYFPNETATLTTNIYFTILSNNFDHAFTTLNRHKNYFSAREYHEIENDIYHKQFNFLTEALKKNSSIEIAQNITQSQENIIINRLSTKDPAWYRIGVAFYHHNQNLNVALALQLQLCDSPFRTIKDLENLAILHVEMGNIDKGLQTYLEYIQYSGHNKDVYQTIAGLYCKKAETSFEIDSSEATSNLIEADKYLEKYNKIYPTNMDGISQRAHIQVILKNNSQAKDLFNQVIDHYEEKLSSVSQHKSGSIQDEKLPSSLQYKLDDIQAASWQKKLITAYYGLEQIARIEKDEPTAIKNLSKILELDAKQAMALRAMGDWHLNKDIPQARKYYQSALAQEVPDHAAHIGLGLTYVLENNTVLARSYFKSVMNSKDPIPSIIKQEVNDLLDKLQDYEKARLDLFKADVLGMLFCFVAEKIEKTDKIQNKTVKAAFKGGATFYRILGQDLILAPLQQKAKNAQSLLLGQDSKSTKLANNRSYTQWIFPAIHVLSYINDEYLGSYHVKTGLDYAKDAGTLASGSALIYVGLKDGKILSPALGASFISSVVSNRLTNWHKNTDDQFPEYRGLYLFEDIATTAAYASTPLALMKFYGDYSDVIHGLVEGLVDGVEQYAPAAIFSAAELSAGAIKTTLVSAKAAVTGASKAVATKAAAAWASGGAMVIVGGAGALVLTGYGVYQFKNYLDYRHVQTLCENANKFQQNGAYLEAKQKFEAALTYDPKNESIKDQISLNSLLLLNHNGNYKEVISQTTEQLPRSNQQEKLLQLRGKAYYYEQNYTLAEQDFLKIKALNSQNTSTDLFLGLIAKAQGKLTSSQSYLKVACQQLQTQAKQIKYKNTSHDKFLEHVNSVEKTLKAVDQQIQKATAHLEQSLDNSITALEKYFVTQQQDVRKLHDSDFQILKDCYLKTPTILNSAKEAMLSSVEESKASFHYYQEKTIKSLYKAKFNELLDLIESTQKVIDLRLKTVSDLNLKNQTIIEDLKQKRQTEIELFQDKVPQEKLLLFKSKHFEKLRSLNDEQLKQFNVEKTRLEAFQKEAQDLQEPDKQKQKLEEEEAIINKSIDKACEDNNRRCWQQAGVQVLAGAIQAGVGFFFDEIKAARQEKLAMSSLPLPNWDMSLDPKTNREAENSELQIEWNHDTEACIIFPCEDVSIKSELVDDMAQPYSCSF